MTRMVMRMGFGLGCMLCLAVLAAGCARGPQRRSQRVPVLVARAEQRDVPYEVEATGTVEPILSASIAAQVGGQVVRLGIREGAEVAVGQMLIQIDPRPFEVATALASAVLARDRAQVATARLDFERAKTLFDQNLIAPGELDQKRAAFEGLAATVRADSANLASARLNLAYATIRAPIAGKTGALSVNLGDVVRANEAGTPLVTINQLRPIRVRFTIAQADLPAVRRGRTSDMRVDVSPADGDSVWIAGQLIFVDNQVDDASGTLLLKGEFANRDGALWPGQFVRVRLRLDGQSHATVVPAVAVNNSQSGPYLYVVKPDTTVETRPVQLGRTWRDLTVIASGVQPGETVVTDGQLRLSPGAKAVLRSASPSPGRGRSGPPGGRVRK